MSDHEGCPCCNKYECVSRECWAEYGRREERERIVAWLRAGATPYLRSLLGTQPLQVMADAIEKGEHEVKP